MNFGQPPHPDAPRLRTVRYELSLPRAWVFEICHRDWADYTEDGRRFPPEGPEEFLDWRLQELGWPTVEEAFTHPDIVPSLMDFFSHECLLRWFGDGLPEEPPGFVISNIESAEMGEVATFTGIAWAAEPSDEPSDTTQITPDY